MNKNKYPLTCTATVAGIKTTNHGQIDVQLDPTCFLSNQQSGLGDMGGFINQKGAIFEVKRVRLDRHGVVHHLGVLRAGNLVPGDKVDCVINEGRRKIAIWLHSAGHVIEVAVRRLRPDWVFKQSSDRPHGPFVSFYGELAPDEARTLTRDIETVVASIITAQSRRKIMAGCPGVHATDFRPFVPVTVSHIAAKKGVVAIRYSIGGDPPFRDRADAGRQLAAALTRYKQCDGIVYPLPRGGAMVGAVVAKQLALPLEPLITRKIGHPANPEEAIGAVAETGEVLWDLPAGSKLPKIVLDQAVEQAQAELARRQRLYLGGRVRASARGKIALVVDDGAASGLTLIAAIKTLLTEQPKQIIIALPVANQTALASLKKYGHVVCLKQIPSRYFTFVGATYQIFTEVADEDVGRALQR